MTALHTVPSLGLERIHTGKVRELFDAGDDRLLMVATDRLSAFDVVMAEAVPNKGRVLTAMSAFWFNELSNIVGNHLISTDIADLPAQAQKPAIAGRIMLCHTVEMLPIECIVRNYLVGSAWKEYRHTKTVHGMGVPEGLIEADEFPEPMFTPSTKAEVGDHDENITFDAAVALIGGDVAEQVRDVSLRMFAAASKKARDAGFLLADTKFELGFIEHEDGQRELVVADEILTPDSSRFWLAEDWEPGTTPQGFDKQPVRDFLESLQWDKRPPAPPLPIDVVAATELRYQQAYEQICGQSLDQWPGAQ